MRQAVRFIILFAMLFVSMSGAARASEVEIGYWQCDGKKWVAVGDPTHPQPLMTCGGTSIGEPLVTQELCEAAGGIWGPIGLFPEPVCTTLTADAGRVCADMGECAASCDANLTSEQYQQMLDGEEIFTTGFCSGAVPLIGCHATIVRGKLEGVLCID